MCDHVVLDAAEHIQRLQAFSKTVLVMPASPEILATYVAEMAVMPAFREARLSLLIAKLHGLTDDYYNRYARSDLQRTVGDLGMALFESADRTFSHSPRCFNVKTILPNGVLMQRIGTGPRLYYGDFMQLW